MSDGSTETTPAAVPSRATQAGEVRARWAWATPEVWSEPMLTALEKGVKGGKGFSVIDKVDAPRAPARAWKQVRANQGASEKKLKDTLREKTRRTNATRMLTNIQEINRTTRGGLEYFKHSHPTTFPALDGWIRMRLRSILRRRIGKRGRGDQK